MQAIMATLPDIVAQRIATEEARRARAHAARMVAKLNGWPTFELTDTGIRCLCCLLESHNPGDIANRYCGFCNMFHEVEHADPV